MLRKINGALKGFIKNKAERRKAFRGKSFSIGKSVLGKEILCYKKGSGNVHVAFVACIHGNEVGTYKLAQKIFEKIDVEGATLYIIPVLNPDGYEVALNNPDYGKGGRVGRLNANGVDLNRNFDLKSFKKFSTWSHGKNYQDKTEVFCGSKGGSEPETKALCKFLEKEKIELLFMLHNAGRDITSGKDKLSQLLAKEFAKKSGYKLFTEEMWKNLKQSGTSKEWCEENEVVFLETEGSNRYSSDFERQGEAIKSCLNIFLDQRRKL